MPGPTADDLTLNLGWFVDSSGGGTPASLFVQITCSPAASTPTVTSVSPTSGSAIGNTNVTITGTDFTGATSVTFGGVAATGVTVVSPTQITATTPAHAAGAVNVAVTTPAGTGSLTNGYTYIALPTVTGASPSSGTTAGSTSVILTGTNFTGATAVTFGGTTASFTVDNATQITATAPAHAAGAVNVTVTTPGGNGTLTNGYTYIAAPTVTGASPTSGPTAGGTNVIITGANFTGATSVTFGGSVATGVTVNSATQITLTAPAHAAGAVDVVVTTPGGSGTLTNGYTYIAPPTVSGASPTSGTTAGGTSVVITGTNFTGATSVTFGGTAATGVTVNSATQITLTAPAHAAGAVNVTVTTPGGSGTLTNGYTYTTPIPVPTVTSISPTSGTTAGSTNVTITGTDFTGVTAVSFGGTAATSFNFVSATQITAVTPAHAAGAVDVVVTTPGGSGTLTNGYTYTTPIPVPTVTSISPTSGTTAGSTNVTITGTDFTGVTAVSFGGTAATSFNFVSATQITAVTPAHGAGAADVVVTTPGGTGTLVGGFTFTTPIPAPTVTSASPTSGTTAGGTSVILTGTDLTGATAVTFGGTAATSFNVDSATQITATAPAHAAGAVNIVVTTPGGSGTLTSGFTFTTPIPAPTVTGAAPTSGGAAGGTVVTLSGTDLTGATAVTFGGTAATSFTVDSATQITATSPAHAAGAVNVVVTTPSGSGTLASGFTYTAVIPVPTVTGVSPASGVTSGGTSVTISGTNLTGATAVAFGGVAATAFTIDNATQITATTPAHAAGAVDVVVTTAGGSGTAAGAFSFTIPIRPDPSLDPEVIGLLTAQASSAKRFAQTQMQNFQSRLERLHHEGDRRNSSMNIGLGANGRSSANDNRQPGSIDDTPRTFGYGTGSLPGSTNAPDSVPQDPNGDYSSDLAVWSGGFVNFGDSSDDDIDSYTTVGVSGGMDYRFSDQFIGGFGIGYGHDRTDVGSNGTESEANAFSGAIYGSYKPVDNLFIDGLLGGSSLDFDSRRFVTPNSEFATGSRDGSQIFGSLTTAYEFRDETWVVSPYGRLEFSRSWLDGFTEKGGGIYGLTYGDQTVDTFSGVLGVRANYSFATDWGVLTPGFRAEYTHDFEGSSRANLGYTDLGGLPYSVDIDPDTEDRVSLQLSLDMQFENDWLLGLDYMTSFDESGDQDNVVRARLAVRF